MPSPMSPAASASPSGCPLKVSSRALPALPGEPAQGLASPGLQSPHSAWAQDLANLLPYLSCGEASAVHVFGTGLRQRLSAEHHPMLAGIAADERRHDALLTRMEHLLPPAQSQPSPQRLGLFFRRIERRDPAEHLARVAALDLAVCRVLQGLLMPGAALRASPTWWRALHGLRQDEARHVRLARQLARELGLAAERQAALDLVLARQLAELLSPVQASLQRLGASWAWRAGVDLPPTPSGAAMLQGRPT